MPVYEYEILNPDGTVGGVLEIQQKLTDAPLSRHPDSGAPLRRVLSATFARTSSGCVDGSCAVPSTVGGCAGGSCGFG